MAFYDQTIPDELVAHTVAICGERGRAWLDGLPQLIDRLEHTWSIRVLAPFPAIEFNFVAPAITDNGEQAVIKIAPPYENHEAQSEARYLRTLDGDGAVMLLAEDRSLKAILLERALPGQNLAEIFAEDKSACLTPTIEVLRHIIRPVPDDLSDILHLDRWFDDMRRFESTQFPSNYARQALDLYHSVLKYQRNYYLHGDLHPANIVSARRSPYLAIDPKGVVGPVGYDIAVFLNNYHWWQGTVDDVQERVDEAVRQFAEAFGLETLTLRQWAYAQMVLGAWWTFDDMPNIYMNEVAKADIWEI